MQSKSTESRGSQARPLPGYQDDILRSLRRIMRAVDLYSRRLITEYGLSGPQLLCLRQLDNPAGMLTGELARAMSLSPATVSGILDRLEAQEFLIRERQQDDKRRVRVRLTPRGRRMVRKAPPPLEHGFLEKLNALPVRRQAQIQDSLSSLVEMMSAGDLDAAPLLITAGVDSGRGPGRGRV
ncbi:MAG: MarR family transcriptional regulator [Gammaproteobacteria bacterium]|jgi:DNA-binding MarR family transcriptional regulator|nr:MarR family transcriptional regulator [Gammaproteobacteria bacterium]